MENILKKIISKKKEKILNLKKNFSINELLESVKKTSNFKIFIIINYKIEKIYRFFIMKVTHLRHQSMRRNYILTYTNYCE